MNVHDRVVAGASAASGIVLAVLAPVVMARIAGRSRRSSWRGDDVFVAVASAFASAALVLAGIWTAVLQLPLVPRSGADAQHLLQALGLLAGIRAPADATRPTPGRHGNGRGASA